MCSNTTVFSAPKRSLLVGDSALSPCRRISPLLSIAPLPEFIKVTLYRISRKKLDFLWTALKAREKVWQRGDWFQIWGIVVLPTLTSIIPLHQTSHLGRATLCAESSHPRSRRHSYCRSHLNVSRFETTQQSVLNINAVHTDIPG